MSCVYRANGVSSDVMLEAAIALGILLPFPIAAYLSLPMSTYPTCMVYAKKLSLDMYRWHGI